jgi:transcriptional regulator GlxA family with amidase domain
VNPDCATSDDPVAPIVILPELWLGPDQTLAGRYPGLIDWIRRRHATGSNIYSVCSGAILQHPDALAQAVRAAGIPERTIKRRLKAATGLPLIDYWQNVRIEHGKRLLETTGLPVEEISAESGYSDVSFSGDSSSAS